MTRILGIDPGSRTTGFGVIDFSANHSVYVAGGCVHVRVPELAAKLHAIFHGIAEVIALHEPAEIVIEQVFINRNPATALKLGQARGAALMAGVLRALPLYEYSPAQIKQAVTGKGNATKEQVQHMVRVLLGLAETPATDVADALAVAVCHGHTRETMHRMERARASAGGAR